MAPMSWVLSHLLDIFHLDEPGEGSSDNGPLESLLERFDDFFRRFAGHFFHPHPCPPDHPSGGSEDTNDPASPSGVNGNFGSGDTHSSADGTLGNIEHGPVSNPVPDGDATHRMLGSNAWTSPDTLPQCNLPGFGSRDKGHEGNEQSASQLEAVPSDQKLGANLVQLVQAMAGHVGNSAGFDPGLSSPITVDPTPQTAIAAAWNQ